MDGRIAIRIARQERQLGEETGQITLWIELVSFSAGDEGPQPRVLHGRIVMSREQPDGMTSCHPPARLLAVI